MFNKWDGELANVAAGMVKKCILTITVKFKTVGENIFGHWDSLNLEELVKEITIEKAPYAWFFQEKDLYDPADIPKFNSDKNSLGKTYHDHGHFTQMIWWNVLRIGCAKIGFKSSNPKYKSQIIITCHYGPAGNSIDKVMYEKGEPCTKCSGQGRTCSTKYKGLCECYMFGKGGAIRTMRSKIEYMESLRKNKLSNINCTAALKT
ncbi:CRISP/Allergen/PR-1 [Armadillidium vulgare]|nr:CRISP/Allergen/PR-1 [Armadillidium vulgare]